MIKMLRNKHFLIAILYILCIIEKAVRNIMFLLRNLLKNDRIIKVR